MKPVPLLLIFILIHLISFSQKTETKKYLVDYFEKPTDMARVEYLVDVYKLQPSDSLWQREMYYARVPTKKIKSRGQSRDSMGQVKQGRFTYFDVEGRKTKEAYFENGKKYGELLQWNKEGKLSLKYHYKNDIMVNDNLSWYDDGKIADSFMLDNTGSGKGTGYYEDGSIRYAGPFEQGIKNGQWYYYFKGPRSKQSLEVIFKDDKVITKSCLDINGLPRTEDCEHFREAEFPGGHEAWVQYVSNSLQNVRAEKYLDGGSKYQVVIKFIVTKDGEISEAEIENPAVEPLDKIALKIIKRSPKWNAAIQFGQRVDVYKRQPVTFVVSTR
jgi:hypothetical protein